MRLIIIIAIAYLIAYLVNKIKAKKQKKQDSSFEIDAQILDDEDKKDV